MTIYIQFKTFSLNNFNFSSTSECIINSFHHFFLFATKKQEFNRARTQKFFMIHQRKKILSSVLTLLFLFVLKSIKKMLNKITETIKGKLLNKKKRFPKKEGIKKLLQIVFLVNPFTFFMVQRRLKILLCILHL